MDKTSLKKEVISELKNILDYWINNTVDETNGGFIGSISQQNVPNTNADKGAILNARILWSFSSAYRAMEVEQYKQMADRAYNYLKNYFYDTLAGGTFWSVDYMGNCTNDRKQVYSQGFIIYALTEYYMITKNKQALNEAIATFKLLEKHSFDTEKGGYIEAFNRNWEDMENVALSSLEPNDKKTMNTHLHVLEAYTNLYRVWKDSHLKQQLERLILDFSKYIVNHETWHLNLFMDENWNVKSNIVSYGHDIEASWLLFEAAEVLGNIKIIEKTKDIALKIAGASLEGMDNDGGLMNEFKKDKNHLDTDKHWWPQAEAMVGFYNAYQLSNDEKYLNQVYKTWQFTKKNIIDHNIGEWNWRVTKDGKVYENEEKTGFWKCPYHNSRFCIELINRIK